MSTSREREELGKLITEKIIPLSCNNNKVAEAYLNRVFFVVRTLDDLYDGDVPVSKENISKAFFISIIDLNNNSFFRDNFEALNSIHLIGFNAWEEANKLENEGSNINKIYAHVMRDFICELFVLVAYITGGHENVKTVSALVRTSFIKNLGE